MNRDEVLEHIVCNDHSLFTEAFLENVNTAFSTKIVARTYRANPRDPKGLTLANGAKSAVGIAAFDLAEELCSALGVRYEPKLGRGFQVQTCIAALRKAIAADTLAGHHPDQSGRERNRRGG